MEVINSISFEEYAGIAAVVMIGCRLIGKSIPDTKTGFLGFIRKASKTIALYVPNRRS